MEFNKYNYSDENITIGSYSSSNNSSSSDTRSDGGTPSRGGSDSRILWGNYDDGGNIEESMKINGNIYIKKTSDDSEDSDDYEWSDTEEEEDFDFDWDDDTEGGSLYVENNVKAKTTEATETYGKKLFVNYPTAASNKENVADLIKNNADRITSNTTNITNLTATVNSHTTQINANTTNISTNADNIATNTSDISDLKNKFISEDRIRELINELIPSNNGSYSNPVILYSGQIRRSYVSNDTYYIEGYKNPNITITIADITDGLMTLEITNSNAEKNGYIYVGAVNVTQAASGDTNDITTKYFKGRSDGAHWFEARSSVTYNKTTIYIREFHQGNGDNDTWYSDTWKSDSGIKQVNVMISGYYYAMPN